MLIIVSIIILRHLLNEREEGAVGPTPRGIMFLPRHSPLMSYPPSDVTPTETPPPHTAPRSS